MEVNDRVKGTRTNEIISSTICWASLKYKIAKILDVFPETIHIQYRFSTDNKDSLPCDLMSHGHLITMLTLLQALVVPPLTKSGCPSAKKMKPVTVQIFNRNDGCHESRSGKVHQPMHCKTF
jgi:hypothetical protein